MINRFEFENTPENGIVLQTLEKVFPAGSLMIHQVAIVETANEDLAVLMRALARPGAAAELPARIFIEPQIMTREQVRANWDVEETMATEPAKGTAHFVITTPKFPENGNGHKPAKSRVSKGRTAKAAAGGEAPKAKRPYQRRMKDLQGETKAAAQEVPADAPRGPLAGQE